MALARIATGRSARAKLIAALARPATLRGLEALVLEQQGAALQRATMQADRDLRWMGGAAGFVCVFGADGYPSALTAIPDPPAVLYGLGDPTASAGLCVAIVGSRQGTAEGRATAATLAADLCRAGVCVVSGLARGIDGAAHRAALEAGGRTIAVLGAGLDRVYPPEHAGLARAVADAGAVISEFPPGTPPLPGHFPQRNRVISGLAAGVVLIEAGEKSGSLTTARHALEQGREVMVVPGAVRTPRSRGGHQLIKQGAALVEDVLDVLEVLGLQVPQALAESRGADPRRGDRPPPGDALGRAICDALGADARTLDELIDRVGSSAAAVSAAVVVLELGGFVRLDGQRYSRAP